MKLMKFYETGFLLYTSAVYYLYEFNLSSGGGLSQVWYVSSMAVGMVSRETTCWSNTTELLNAFLI